MISYMKPVWKCWFPPFAAVDGVLLLESLVPGSGEFVEREAGASFPLLIGKCEAACVIVLVSAADTLELRFDETSIALIKQGWSFRAAKAFPLSSSCDTFLSPGLPELRGSTWPCCDSRPCGMKRGVERTSQTQILDNADRR